MITLFIASSDGLLVARRQRERWHTERQLEGTAIACIASDPLRPEHVYCGTYGQGVWRSVDAGASWVSIAEGIHSSDILSIAVSSVERVDGVGVVYAGSEPTALFRSQDGGSTWRECLGLTALPSATTWSFPPKPWTHHARWITLDPLLAGRVWVCIEAGALVRSDDSGQTWQDRQPGAPYDTHTLRAHPLAPDRLYAAAGDGLMAPGAGYMESRDGGTSWERLGQGLHHHYLWGLAVDPADPDTIIVSAAVGPQQAHNPSVAAATLYRKSASQGWHEVSPVAERAGALAYSLSANIAEPGVFYAASNQGCYRSPDAGLHWEQMAIAWPDEVRMHRVSGLEVVEL